MLRAINDFFGGDGAYVFVLVPAGLAAFGVVMWLTT